MVISSGVEYPLTRFALPLKRMSGYSTPEDMTTALQDALYDCDWLPFDAFGNDATLDGADIRLHGERYQVLVVPPTELITLPVLAKAKAFFDQGGVVVGYGRLPSQSGTIGKPSHEIAELCNSIWGDSPVHGAAACHTSPAGGRSYFLPETPDVATITAALKKDAGIPQVVEVLDGETDNWLHVLHRVKDGSDVFLVCNQDHVRKAKKFQLKFAAEGFPEIWDAMRNEIRTVPFTRKGSQVEIPLTLEPMESVLVVFNKQQRPLTPRVTDTVLAAATVIPVTGGTVSPPAPPKPLIKSPPKSGITLSPVTARPYAGSCQAPDDLDLTKARVYLEMENLESEEAARVTINGKDAGGFIGRPFRLDVTRHLKAGSNTVQIEPFAPESARLRVIHTTTNP